MRNGATVQRYADGGFVPKNMPSDASRAMMGKINAASPELSLS